MAVMGMGWLQKGHQMAGRTSGRVVGSCAGMEMGCVGTQRGVFCEAGAQKGTTWVVGAEEGGQAEQPAVSCFRFSLHPLIYSVENPEAFMGEGTHPESQEVVDTGFEPARLAGPACLLCAVLCEALTVPFLQETGKSMGRREKRRSGAGGDRS